ncbi:MAG: hypothetical protein GY949_03765 [Gammaproteobacteria bacterium]|nr:hypothetical protein [Gammaproteobacteria bacterium]
MSKLDDIKNDVSTRSKSLLGVMADVMESVFEPTLALADDLAGFTTAQLRLPTQANDFGDYRSRSKDAYSKFGTTLKGHGTDLIDVVREVPGQIKDALTVEAKPARKAPARKKAAAKKKVAAKK